MPAKVIIGSPQEEAELFSSEAWQNASHEKRQAFVAKVRALKKVEQQSAKNQKKKQKVASTGSKSTAYVRKKEVRRAKSQRKKQRLAEAKKLGLSVQELRLTKKTQAPKPTGVDVTSVEFLSTYEWRKTRMIALKKYGARCQCCGASAATGAVIHVDHIKPRKLFPQLALDVDNLQVLCHECNHGKGNWDMTDWRTA